MDGNGERVDMMKVLVTGADGMLGRDVMRALREKHVNARGVDVADFDVTDGAAVREWVTAEQPDAIIHSYKNGRLSVIVQIEPHRDAQQKKDQRDEPEQNP